MLLKESTDKLKKKAMLAREISKNTKKGTAFAIQDQRAVYRVRQTAKDYQRLQEGKRREDSSE